MTGTVIPQKAAPAQDQCATGEGSGPDLKIVKATADVAFTVVTSVRPLTKTYDAGPDGEPKKTEEPTLWKGEARRVVLAGTADEIIQGLATSLVGLSQNQAVILAPPRSGKEMWPLATKEEALTRPEFLLARTPSDFRPPDGPAIIFFDCDIDDYPEHILEKLSASGTDLSGVFHGVCPALAPAACVVRSSVSSAVRRRGGKAKLKGQHRFYIALSGTHSSEFFERLNSRLILAGWAWGFVTKSGHVLIRTLFDLAASRDLSRLVFEADPLLASDALELVPRRLDLKPGGFLDTSQCAPLTEEEQEQVLAAREDIARRMAPAAVAARTAWKAERRAAMLASGADPAQVDRTLHIALEHLRLWSGFPIKLDDGRVITVSQILEAPAEFHALTCADPMEWDYGGGKNKAVIFTLGGKPHIWSHAHGGIDYELSFFEESHLIEAAPSADGGVETAKRLAVSRLNKQHAMVLSGGKAIVLRESRDTSGRLSVEFGTVEGLRHWYANDKIRLNDGEKSVSVFDVWRSSPDRRQFHRIVFAPEGAPGDAYNLWQGFSVAPDASASCELFLTHLRENVCRGNMDHYRWVVGFFAQMIQRPGEKLGVAMVLRGGQGVGKSIVGKYVGALFPAHHVEVSQPDHLTGRFNAHLERAMLVQAEEAFWAGDRHAAGGALKDMVTSDRMRIERKGIDTIEVRNNIRLLITTNSRWSIPAGLDERRFAVFDVGDGRKQDAPYFGAIIQEMRNGGLPALLHYLQSFALSSVDLHAIPRTEALRDQKIASLELHVRWWLTRLEEGSFGYPDVWPAEISKPTLYENYRREAERLGRPISNAELAKELIAICPPIRTARPSGGDRQRVWVLPSLAECRSAFEAHFGQSISWE